MQGHSQPHSSGWAKFPLFSLFLKFLTFFRIFPQTFLIFFLILALWAGESPTREGPGYTTEKMWYYRFIIWEKYHISCLSIRKELLNCSDHHEMIRNSMKGPLNLIFPYCKNKQNKIKTKLLKSLVRCNWFFIFFLHFDIFVINWYQFWNWWKEGI